jgi:glucan 1,3-beta-glucosidase
MGRISFVFIGLILTIWTTEISGLGSSCKGNLGRSHQSQFWVPHVAHGMSAFNYDPPSYKVFRSVKDFGAKGDGVADDTAAINSAIVFGNRCGEGCGSSTVTPAMVYFPPGKYVVSGPLILDYYTQLIGDAIDLPTLIMHPDFKGGIGLVDSDPYGHGGNSWWTNQNNFYHQVRNFIIDTTKVPASKTATGIHWQVAQATSVTNVHFKLSTEAGNKHQGIWMENGSGGFISDLTFDGGRFALWVGNQQFTSRNLTITNAETAIYMNWNWGWTFKGISISKCKAGIEMYSGGENKQNVGSLLLMDSVVKDTETMIKTDTSEHSKPVGSGALIIDNVHITNVKHAVASQTGKVILDGGSKVIESWGQGRVYDHGGKAHFNQGPLPAPAKPAVLLDSKHPNKVFFERPKPYYLDVALTDFVNVKAEGAKGDGKTDDTKAIQSILEKYAGCKVIYFPAGTYLVHDTVHVPPGSRIVGEVWSVISATGNEFSDPKKPKVMFEIGKPGDHGVAELSELIFSTHGPAPGAILVQINMRDPNGEQGAVGLWDVHFRVGGAKGTDLQDYNCVKSAAAAEPRCFGAFLMLHLAPTSSAYLENLWAWVADHDLDGNNQISVFNARGILSESTEGPVWMYGTASEHSVLYQYNIVNSKNLVMGMIQTETPYYQSRPPAPKPFSSMESFHDPDYSHCDASSKTCPMAWGLRIYKSSDIFVYGAGLYNFFLDYDQACLKGEHCQDSMVSIEQSPKKVYIYNLSTKAADSMVNVDNKSFVPQKDNRATFCSTIAAFLEN